MNLLIKLSLLPPVHPPRHPKPGLRPLLSLVTCFCWFTLKVLRKDCTDTPRSGSDIATYTCDLVSETVLAEREENERDNVGTAYLTKDFPRRGSIKDIVHDEVLLCLQACTSLRKCVTLMLPVLRPSSEVSRFLPRHLFPCTASVEVSDTVVCQACSRAVRTGSSNCLPTNFSGSTTCAAGSYCYYQNDCTCTSSSSRSRALNIF